MIELAVHKVVVIAFHDELESAFPPLNVAVGAISSGADVILAFSKDGMELLRKDFRPQPSPGKEEVKERIEEFGAPSFQELMEVARESGVRMVSTNEIKFPSDWDPEIRSIKWVLNEAADADLFVHF